MLIDDCRSWIVHGNNEREKEEVVPVEREIFFFFGEEMQVRERGENSHVCLGYFAGYLDSTKLIWHTTSVRLDLLSEYLKYYFDEIRNTRI